MKYRSLIIALLLMPLSTVAQKFKGDSWAKVKSAGSGNLSVVYYETAGLIQDVNGSPTGLCVDVLDDFVKFIDSKYKTKVSIKYLSKEPVFANMLAAAQNNDNVIGVTNVTITEERKKTFKFTPPFISNTVVLITHKDAPVVANLKDLPTQLDGFTSQIIAGTTHEQHINKIKKNFWPNLVVTFSPSNQDILKKITTNPKLFTIMDLTEFVDATRKRLPLKKQDLDFGSREELAFVMNKQSDWDVVWNEFLTDEYRKSAKYRKNIADNLGSAFLSVMK